MPEELLDTPIHPLLVHVPVVLVPLLALLVAAYALVPLVRPHVRWVTGLLALATPVAALLAKLSGDDFFARLDAEGRITESFYPVLQEHQDFGNYTLYSTIALAVLALALVYLVPPRRADAAGPGGPLRVRSFVLGALSVVAAAVSFYFVVRTGDSGAGAAWSDF
jgi:hypothetical protein